MPEFAFALLGNQGIVSMGAVGQKMLLLTTAASLVHEVGNLPIGGEGLAKPTEGMLGLLQRHTNWAAHGYENAVLALAEFLHEAIPHIFGEDGIGYIFEHGEAMLIVAALEAYQIHCEKVRVAEKAVHGENWGSSDRDWTDRNPIITRLYQTA